MKKVLFRLFIVLLASSLMVACGFKLRDSQALPEQFKHVTVQSASANSLLARALTKRLPVYQLSGESITNGDDESSPELVRIILKPEQYERTLLSVFTTGQVAEYELIYTVRYRVLFPNKQAIDNEISVSRQYQDDPDQILAKSRELDLVLEDMRDEASDRIIRLLSNQYTSAYDINHSEE